MTEPGEVGVRLLERGYELSTVTVVPESHRHAPNLRFDFPAAQDWDLIVSLGAPWSVYDDAAIGNWIGGELALLRTAHHLGVPVLGVCFGAQALAAALGGSVETARRAEIGWIDVETDDPALVPPGPWFVWHFDRCVIPPGAVELARSDVCTQAFMAGSSLGVQFHPEITTAAVEGWLGNGGAEQVARHGVDPDALLARSRAMQPYVRCSTRRLVDGFLDGIPSRLPASQAHPARRFPATTPAEARNLV
ncbi:type 1 glutamine amidotransferase [Streptacidiphilus sp. MAP12-16]|uniref:type 1 glutamine amidotransferase n=1 Tax=Streptacidiphilus sp. MAP12-16 TaxID=3156300 RepID=UPI003512B90E